VKVLRFVMVLTATIPCFLMLGLAIRYSSVIKTIWHREAPVSIQRLSDELAVGQLLPMKKELMGGEARMHVLVARSERTFWQGADPLECMNEECGSAFGVVKKLGGALYAFTNYDTAAKAWGIPLVSDRWGTRPAETVAVVANSDGTVATIYRHADLDNLDVVLGAIR
jgi:hypothetical protein